MPQRLGSTSVVRTTGFMYELKPEIHTSITAEKDEAALARQYSTKTYTGGAAAEVRVYTYVCIQVRHFHKPVMYGGSV